MSGGAAGTCRPGMSASSGLDGDGDLKSTLIGGRELSPSGIASRLGLVASAAIDSNGFSCSLIISICFLFLLLHKLRY